MMSVICSHECLESKWVTNEDGDGVKCDILYVPKGTQFGCYDASDQGLHLLTLTTRGARD